VTFFADASLDERARPAVKDDETVGAFGSDHAMTACGSR
jgi:hypothetical protein